MFYSSVLYRRATRDARERIPCYRATPPATSPSLLTALARDCRNPLPPQIRNLRLEIYEGDTTPVLANRRRVRDCRWSSRCGRARLRDPNLSTPRLNRPSLNPTSKTSYPL